MKQSNLKIAITGGIGSGKSTVCKIIKAKGYPVFSCDEIYAELLNDGNLTEDIVKYFGSDILNGGGGIDRKKLASRVFNDGEKLRILNGITHPKIFEEMFTRAENCGGVVFFEVPVLFECGYQNLFDNVIVVLRNRKDRVEYVKIRDNISDKEVENRINKQYDYDNSNFAQYYVIHNCGKIDDLSDIIDKILLKITISTQK